MELVPFIFKIPGVNWFLSERISQDPLEKYFGRQRQKGGTNDNPNLESFLKNSQIVRVSQLLGMCQEETAMDRKVRSV